MPSNVEIKARLPDRGRAVAVAKELSGSEGEVLEQEDTFFRVAQGRLKLRVQSGRAAMLILYQRPDSTGPKISDYTIATTQTPEVLKTILTHSLGHLGCVKKRRLLFLVGQTRIHIDTVHGLGEFLELEVEMQAGQLPSEGEAIANNLMACLGIAPDNLISGAYMDLILQGQHMN